MRINDLRLYDIATYAHFFQEILQENISNLISNSQSQWAGLNKYLLNIYLIICEMDRRLGFTTCLFLIRHRKRRNQKETPPQKTENS